MSDRTSPQIQLWTWPTGLQTGPSVPAAEPVRIGDAERDQAVSSLGDHFAAGRLTREEFDTRVDEAMAARYDGDLRPLFADLPRSEPAPVAVAASPQVPAMRSVTPMLLASLLPFLMVGAVVTAVVLSAPWLLWGFVWVLLLSSMMGRRRPYPGAHHRR